MAKHVDLNDVSKPALIRAAHNAVAGALAGDFPVDPIIGPELSRAISCIGSVVKRHGALIELGIAGALKANDRFIVLTNVPLPLTKGAAQLLDARNSDEDLANIRLSADSEAEGIVNVDMVVVDPEAGWAGAYEIKRGNETVAEFPLTFGVIGAVVAPAVAILGAGAALLTDCTINVERVAQ